MINEIEPVEVQHYPLTGSACEVAVRSLIFNNLAGLLGELPMNYKLHCSTLRSVWRHFQTVERLYDLEARCREFGAPWANLYYHNKSHGLYQTTYDAISITRAILSRDDALSGHLTQEGAISIVLAAIYHDAGYVYGVNIPENFAARTPIHVEVGMESLEQSVNADTLPRYFDHKKIAELAKLGILSTKFPFTEDVKNTIRGKLDGMSPELRKEAQIVRLATQFADLGGQIARVDYFPAQVKNLREELNGANSGLGDLIVGQGSELAGKCRGFIEKMAYPLLEKTGLAFFRTREHSFKTAWDRQGS